MTPHGSGANEIVARNRSVAADLVAIIAAGLLLYGATMLRGVGWDSEARWQSALADDRAREIHETALHLPAEVLAPIVRFWPPSARAGAVTALSVVSAIAGLVAIYFALRTYLNHRGAILSALVATGFSHGYFLAAVRPSPFALHAALFAALCLGLFRGAATRRWSWAFTALVSGGAAILLYPPCWVTVASVAVYTALSFRGAPLPAAVFASAPGVLFSLLRDGSDPFGTIAFFGLFEFPFAGWFFLVSGVLHLRRRSPFLLGFIFVGLATLRPDRDAIWLPDHFGSLLPVSILLGVLVGFGIDLLYERLDSFRGLAAPVIVVALVLFPILGWSVFLRHYDHPMALKLVPEKAAASIRLDAVRNDFWYALWPPKNDQGATALVEYLDGMGEGRRLLLADRSVASAIRYVQDVEKRLPGWSVHVMPAGDQASFAAQAADGGVEVYLAGSNMRDYDVSGLAARGEFVTLGGVMRWIPKEAF